MARMRMLVNVEGIGIKGACIEVNSDDRVANYKRRKIAEVVSNKAADRAPANKQADRNAGIRK